MFQRLRFFLYSVMFVFAFTSCEKELSYEGGGIPVGPGTAEYTFSGGTADCTGAVISGTYTVGVATGSSNTVELEVLVDSTGTYNISIPAVNGIAFTGSGTFITDGLQTITLTAAGTPTAAGDLNFSTGGSGCSFLVTVAPGGGSSGGTAVYTFDGGTASCTGAVLNGTYTAGTALTSANTVTLGVTVTTAGSYNISTTAANGITFSGAGTFGATGAQAIALTASGMPGAAGTFNFTAGASGCTFSVPVEPASTATSEYYFDVTVEGERIIKDTTETDITGYIVGYGYNYAIGTDDIILTSSIVPYADPTPLNMPYIEVVKGVLANYSSVTDNAFKAFFSPGVYPYAAPSSFEGIEIRWIDKNKKTWSTSKAPGTQTGSNFTIISSDNFTGPFGDYTVKFSATFNCTLYDDAGNSITLTNGKYVCDIIK